MSKGVLDETWWIEYDHMNRIVSVTIREEDDVASAVLMQADYKFDAIGRRIEKAVDADGDGGGGTVTTRFAYDGTSDSILALLDTNNALTVRYVHGDVVNQHFARVTSGGTVSWYMQDHLQSVTEIINNSATVIAALGYDSFGVQLTAEDADADQFRHTGAVFDIETGLYHHWYRDRGPWFAGWMQEDPHPDFFPDGGNNRSYVNNNPLVFADPSGLQYLRPPDLPRASTDGIVNIYAPIDRPDPKDVLNKAGEEEAKRISELRRKFIFDYGDRPGNADPSKVPAYQELADAYVKFRTAIETEADKVLDAKQRQALDGWVDQLDSDDFKKRRDAMENLNKWGIFAAHLLRRCTFRELTHGSWSWPG